jgi:hypothetical protein
MIKYSNQNQISIEKFETPFQQKLNAENRWVKLSKSIPWDSLATIYYKTMSADHGRPGVDARRIIGAIIIKHKQNLSDEETVMQIQENAYLQYFLGYTAYNETPVFSPTLFVEIRKRLGAEKFDEMNTSIIEAALKIKKIKTKHPSGKGHAGKEIPEESCEEEGTASNSGRLILDATVAEQAIKYPNDLELLNDSREISEQLIDLLFAKTDCKIKPRTYRRKARREFLSMAKKKKKSRKELRKAIGRQLSYLSRNLGHIKRLLDKIGSSPFPLPGKEQKRYWIIQEIYRQQKQMYDACNHSCSDRIVSISQPHVRPILRGKARSNTEFGAKIGVSLWEGYAVPDTISWNAYNESSDLIEQCESYKRRLGHYPEFVSADNIYGTKANRDYLKGKGIKFSGKPLGRPRKETEENKTELRKERQRRKQEYRERIPIEGKFGQGKNGYRLNYIRAKLQSTSESWISSIFFVMNIVKLTSEKINSFFYSAVFPSKIRFKELFSFFRTPHPFLIAN